VALFHSAGREPLFIVMSSNHARYGIMAYPPSFNISPEILSGTINYFFFLFTPTFSLVILVSMVKGSPEWETVCVGCYSRYYIPKNISNLENYFFYQICDKPSITVFDGRNIFPL
jgi:hypothetical protein